MEFTPYITNSDQYVRVSICEFILWIDAHVMEKWIMDGFVRKMCAPRSKKAVTVQRKANPACRIWFLCKGNLICTRY